MESLELRQTVLDYIKNKADHRLLRMIKALTDSYQEEQPERDTIEQYNADIDRAIQEIENGNFYTHEEVKEMMKKW
jgi:predicted transcriptional regulator